MNRTIRVTALALIGISLLAASVALSMPPGGRRAAAATQTVAVQTTPVLQFSPSTLTVSVGDTVQWDWPATNDVPHTVTSDPPGTELASAVQALGSYSNTFGTVGTYNYHCEIHPAMTGTITVQAPAPTATSTNTAVATNTAAPTSTRTATPVATGTAAASATPVITPTNTSGIAPTVIAPAPPPVAPASSGGAAGAGGLPRAGTGGAPGATPLSRISIVLALAGLLALGGAGATWRRA
jgi:plastocyanin